MLRNPIVTGIVLLLLSLLQKPALSQCITPPPLDSCSITDPQLTDNETLGVGAKKWYAGTPAVYNALTLRGGTLVVCGDLTIDKFTMDSGTVVIRPGARFVIGTGIGYGVVLKGNSAIYNYGTVECRRNLSLDYPHHGVTQPNIVINVLPSSIFDLQFVYFGISSPNSFFVNNGRSQFHGLSTDAAAATGSVCLGPNSQTKMHGLYTRARLPYTAPSGPACLQVTHFSQFYDTLTRDPQVYVCLGPSHVSDASCGPWGCRPSAWGTPNRFVNCGSCSEIVVLPVSLYDFKVRSIDGYDQLSWKTDMPPHHHKLQIEQSADGSIFNTVDSISVTASSRQVSFNTRVAQDRAGKYYRVRCVNQNTGFTTSTPIIKIDGTEQQDISLFPNPFQSSFKIRYAGNKIPMRVIVSTSTGQILTANIPAEKNASWLELRLPANAPSGLYFVKLIYEKETIIKQIIKE